jgi:hypothetical protein
VSLRPLSTPLRPFHCQHCLIAGVNDTIENFDSGVVDTGEQFFGGVNTTAEKWFTSVNDTGNKTVLTIRQQCLRPPGSDVAADGVIETTMTRRIH